MEIEDVAGVGLTTRRAAQQERDLPVSPGLLREVVVNDEGVFTVIAEVLAHAAARVGRDELHGRRVGSACRHDDGVLHGAVLFQGSDDVGDRRHLLPDGHVDAANAAVLLVDNGVDGDGRLADLPVADDQLPLAPTDGHHGVDALQPDLHGLIHRLPGNHAWGNLFDGRGFRGVQRPFAVDGVAEGIHDPTEQLTSHRDLENPPGAACRHPFG